MEGIQKMHDLSEVNAKLEEIKDLSFFTRESLERLEDLKLNYDNLEEKLYFPLSSRSSSLITAIVGFKLCDSGKN